MKRQFKAEKIPLETLLEILHQLYENGFDYVDFTSDCTDPAQDKLIIQTCDDYLSDKFIAPGEPDPNAIDELYEDDEDFGDIQKPTTTIETTYLSEEDLNDLI